MMGRIIQTLCCFVVFQKVLTEGYNNAVIKLFQEYIQINTTTGADLSPAVEFWKRLAKEENVPISVYEFVKSYPVLVMKWPGKDPSLSSVMLNSHMDVVPAFEQDGWKYPPFAAHIDDNGDIYGRGTQDVKSLAIQQFEALRRLKQKGIPMRNVYMTLMPDEETGSANGMIKFIKSKEFTAMNVGVEMDEGWAQPHPNTVSLFIQDKAVWQFRVDCYGSATHSSLFPATNSTAVGKCMKLTQQVYRFREEQYAKAKNNVLTNAGAYTSISLVMMSGGNAMNVIPGLVSFAFDVRLGTAVDEEQFLLQLKKWIKIAGDNVTLTFLQKDPQTPATVGNSSNPYWQAISDVAQANNITLSTIVSTGATDAKYLRARGIPAFGLSPMMNTPLRPHKVDERLNAAEFLRGLAFYEELVKKLANIPASKVSKDPSVYVTKN